MHLKFIARSGALLALFLTFSPTAIAGSAESPALKDKDRDNVEVTIRDKDYVFRDRDRDMEFVLRERDYVFRDRDNEYVFSPDSFNQVLAAYPNVRDYSRDLTGEQESSQLLEAFAQIELKIKNKTPLSATEKALIRSAQTNRDFAALTGLLKIKADLSTSKD
jgi:hypothetical protein